MYSISKNYLANLLKELCSVPGVSGAERPVREYIAKYIKELCPSGISLYSDTLGNLVVKLGEGSPKIALMAHMDEVGIVVKSIEERGLIRFSYVGGLDTRVMLGQVVAIYGSGSKLRGKSWWERKVLGVVGVKPIHLLSEEERKKVPDVKELFIDIGLRKREEVEELIQVGDVGHVERSFIRLPTEIGDVVSARALDDRAGCAVLLGVLKQLIDREVKPQATLYLVFTVQEEIGLRGSRVITYKLHEEGLEKAIIIDVTHAAGYPGLEYIEYPVELGKGPAISRGPPVHEELTEQILEIANRLKVRDNEFTYQIVPEAGRTGTDLDVAQIVRTGIEATVVSIPLRYMHTGSEVVNLKDLENTVKLLVETILKLGS
ncbi:MAG: M42 family peptidase [Thermoprotei archaeon]|nr:MAG: M42 family peptidase [Thermoprotei archaeon]